MRIRSELPGALDAQTDGDLRARSCTDAAFCLRSKKDSECPDVVVLTQLALRPLGRPTLVKGERGGVPNAYSLTSAFSVVGKDLHGECNLVGTFHADADSPQRLHVAFTGAAGFAGCGLGAVQSHLSRRKRWLG